VKFRYYISMAYGYEAVRGTNDLPLALEYLKQGDYVVVDSETGEEILSNGETRRDVTPIGTSAYKAQVDALPKAWPEKFGKSISKNLI
jgi:hypothetical protein